MKTRTIRCYPEEEDVIIDRMYLLGYILKHRNEIDNVREVYDGTTSLTRGDYTSSTVYTHQERTHYVSLVFEKDITDPELDQKLGEIEKSVDNTINFLNSASIEAEKAKYFVNPPKWSKIISNIAYIVTPLVVVALFIYGIIVAVQYGVYLTILFSLILGIVMGAVFFFRIKKTKKYSARLRELTPIIQKKNEELDNLLRKAKKYEPAVRDNYKKLP